MVAACAADPVATSSPPPTSAAPTPTPIACDGPLVTGRWWDDRVFYEIFVRSFADSDGDGIGDFRGLIERLDYLNDGDPGTGDDLGVTGVWLMPIASATSYHGYDVTDYRSIDPAYGTADDLRTFVEAAHARGIAVILDLVLNHTSVEHPWFQQSRQPGSPREDWYLWSDTDPGYPGPGGQPAWHRDGDRWYYGAFWSGMPDLNLENPEVTAELLDIARAWLDEYGVDGFRLDAIKHLMEDGRDQLNTPASRAWLAGFAAELRRTHPDVLLVGEVFDVTAASSAFVREGGMDLAFDFPLARGFLQAPNLEDVAPLTGARRDALTQYPRGGYAAFLTNHDQNRAMTELGGSTDGARLAATLLLTDPGVPFLYYGEEIGVGGRKPDERLRLPMPWTGDGPAGGFSTAAPWQPMGDDWPRINVASQADDPASLLATYRELIRLRDAHPALRTGAAYPVAARPSSVAALLRSTPEASVLVLMNLGTEAVPAPELALESGPLCSVGGMTVVYGRGADGAPLAGDLGLTPPELTPTGGFAGWTPVDELPPRSAVVIVLRP